jgi:diguanylate cyclase (GGDEF)-like protein
LQKNVETSVAALQEVEKSATVLEESIQSLIQAAMTDDMTLLESKLSWEQTLAATENERSVEVVIFGDVNNLKNLNSLSHDAGDYAIQHICTMIKSLVVDQYQTRAFHISGDEFIILLRQKFLENFITMSSENFANISFEFAEKPISTSISFGYAIKENEIDLKELAKRADLACREAKRRGKGRCVQWTQDISENAFVEKRGECPNCQTQINCDIPIQNQILELRFCPICSTSLVEDTPQ